MAGRRLAVAALAFSLVAAACGGGDDSDTSSNTSSGGANEGPVDPDATVRTIGTAPPPGSWDPATVENATQGTFYFPAVYDSLLYLNGDNELEPLLATAWEYDTSGTVLTLTLRDDVTFSDGSQFDAGVAKLNLDRVREGTGGSARLLLGIESIEAPSPTELVITQAAPNVKLLFALATTAASMASPQAIEDPQALAQQPVGSGPFLLDSVDGTSATFVRNDDYWNTDVEYTARLIVSGATDGNARINAILSDTADFASLGQTAPTPDIQQGVDAGTLQMQSYPGVPNTVGINNTVAPLDDPRVVEAINLAIDRDTYNEVVWDGQCEPTSQLFPTALEGHVDDLAYEFDLERARELMDEAGVGEVTLEFQSIAGAPTAPVELLQSMLGEIGITLDVTASPVEQVFPNFFSGQFALSSLNIFMGAPDPSYVTDYITGPLNPGTKDPALVDMVTEANALDVDDPARGEAYEAISEYVFENPVAVPLCERSNNYVATPDVVGIDSVPFATIGGADLTRLGLAAG